MELNIPGPVLSCQALLATTTMHSSLSQHYPVVRAQAVQFFLIFVASMHM